MNRWVKKQANLGKIYITGKRDFKTYFKTLYCTIVKLLKIHSVTIPAGHLPGKCTTQGQETLDNMPGLKRTARKRRSRRVRRSESFSGLRPDVKTHTQARRH